MFFSLIRRHFKFLHKDIVVRLYKQMVRPHLEYAVQAWNPFLAKDRIVLESVQRRATKLVSSISSLSYEQRLTYLRLTTLELRRVRGDLIQVFKIVHGFDKLKFDDFVRCLTILVPEVIVLNYVRSIPG